MFIDKVYSSPACNLKQYSKNEGRKKTLKDYDTVLGSFTKVTENARHSTDRRWSEGQHFLQMILIIQQQTTIRKRDLCEQLGVSLQWVQRHIAILMMHNLIEVHKGGYKSTAKFNLFMQQWQSDKDVEDMLDAVGDKIGKMALNTDHQDEFNLAAHDAAFVDPMN